MTELDDALDAFLTEIANQSLSNRVLVANTSEFGRRASQNQTGFDHGTASVMFLAGAAHPGVYGARPSWSSLDPNGTSARGSASPTTTRRWRNGSGCPPRRSCR